MSEIEFEPHYNKDSKKLDSVIITIYKENTDKEEVFKITAKDWISNVEKYLPNEVSSGEIYLDKSMSKIVIDVMMVNSLECSWIELTPDNCEKIVISTGSIKGYNITGLGCEYPFSVSSNKSSKSINMTDDNVDKVTFQVLNANKKDKDKAADKYNFIINQGSQNECLNTVISKGNQIRNIDTSAGNTINPSFYFKGEVGTDINKIYIDGEFIRIYNTNEQKNDFGFYYESKCN